MIKLESQYDETAPKIMVEVSSDSTLSEVLEVFEAFLKASGYSFSGTLDILEEITDVEA